MTHNTYAYVAPGSGWAHLYYRLADQTLCGLGAPEGLKEQTTEPICPHCLKRDK